MELTNETKKKPWLSIFAMFAVVILYFLFFGEVLKWIGLDQVLRDFVLNTNFSKPDKQILAVGLSLFIQEIPIVLILLVLNKLIWKQKIIIRKFPIGRSLLVMIYPIFIMFVAGITAVSQHLISAPFFFLALLGTLSIGLAEELAFRGLILGKLTSSGQKVIWALLISSLLFALTHGINARHQPLATTLIQVAYTFPMGLVMGAIYIKTKNFIYPIVFHGVQDFIAVLASGGSTQSSMTNPFMIIPVYAIFGGMAFFILYGDSQGLVNFSNILQNKAEVSIEQKLPALAYNKNFRKFALILSIVWDVIFIGLFFALAASFGSGKIATAGTGAEMSPLQVALTVVIFGGIFIQIMTIVFFNYKKVHLLWYLIPAVGTSVFAILGLTNSIKPKYEQKPKKNLQTEI